MPEKCRVLASLAALFVAVTCSSQVFAETPPELIGTWEYATPAGATLTITLDKDGAAKMDSAPLKYTVEGDKLSMIDGDTTTAYKFSAAGDTLKLSGGDLDREVTFHRKGGAKKGLLGGKLKALDASKPNRATPAIPGIGSCFHWQLGNGPPAIARSG